MESIKEWITKQINRADRFYIHHNGATRTHALALDAAIQYGLDYSCSARTRRILIRLVDKCAIEAEHTQA